jgi:phosphatidylglycerophosphatase A
MEIFKGGWGVMADDLLAGIYANIVLQLIVKLA